jgi:hypothetical protein
MVGARSILNAARYYERVPNDLAVRSLSNEAGLGQMSWNDWSLTGGGPSPANQTTRGRVTGGTTSVADGTKLPYVDEYVLGWQQELGRDVSYEVRGIYREQGRALEDVQFATVEATENYYAYGYWGTAPPNIDRVPFPNDPAVFAPDPNDPTFLVPDRRSASTSLRIRDRIRRPDSHCDSQVHCPRVRAHQRFGNHWLFTGNMWFARLAELRRPYRNDNGQSIRMLRRLRFPILRSSRDSS